MAVSVRLAGYNVDADLLREVTELLQTLEQEGSTASSPHAPPGDAKRLVEILLGRIRGTLNSESFTPETISAAYARISREPKHVTELRRAARFGVARARKSNENIIFGLGHASVAEHACFNFDVSGISRLASEDLQSHRLLSFTEKSQRYITIGSDYVVPPEAAGTQVEAELTEVVPELFRGYNLIAENLREKYYRETVGEISPQLQRDLENKAKEDARYLLPLCCATQMGMTMNARNVEHVVRDLSDHPLAELRELGKAITESVAGLAPSLVKYLERGSYPRENRASLRSQVSSDDGQRGQESASRPEVKIISSTPEAEQRIASALWFSTTQSSWPEAGSRRADRELWRTVFRGMGPHDSTPREFELAVMTFEAVISASCFAQLKRHRMMTLLCQSYDTSSGFVVPPSIEEYGLHESFTSLCERSVTSAARLADSGYSLMAPYLLTNAHRKRVLIQANARELYHFARLRCDAHAQWEIRMLARGMIIQAQKLWPNVLALACGKDEFQKTCDSYFSG